MKSSVLSSSQSTKSLSSSSRSRNASHRSSCGASPNASPASATATAAAGPTTRATLDACKNNNNICIPIEEQILNASSVLGAFGYCATQFNTDASRVVKVIDVNYDTSGRLLAGNVTVHAYEKVCVIPSAIHPLQNHQRHLHNSPATYTSFWQ